MRIGRILVFDWRRCGHGNKGYDWQSGITQQALGYVFVHRGGRSNHTGANKGHLTKLKRALNCSVFTVGPVQNREDDVEARHFARCRRVWIECECSPLPTRQECKLRPRIWDDERRVAGAGSVSGVGNDPSTISVDCYQRDFVSIRVESA